MYFQPPPLQATKNVVEGHVISTHTLDNDGCNTVLLCVHLYGAGASDKMYIVVLVHHGNNLFLVG